MLKMGMVGGGPGSMIGDIHRITATARQKAELVCGAFSTSKEKNLEKGRSLGLPGHRVYQDIDTLLASEKKLPADQRMDFLTIATPNHLHVDAAIKALEAGFHVMCDKPLGLNLAEALKLQEVVRKSQLKFGMTYTYRGYAATKQLAQMVKDSKVGTLRKVMIDYSQGWLSQLVENEGNKQASWRTDPKYSGAGGTIADIGTHAFNMAEFVAGQKVTDLVADVSIMVEGRKIDDDANALLKFENGAVGTLSVSQVCAGEDNALRLKVYGDKGALLWNHAEPATIIYKTENTENTIATDELDIDLTAVKLQLPPGHPEGFLKGFIDIYDNFIDSISTGRVMPYPNIEDGVRGMLFIEKAINSSKRRQWVSMA